MQKFTVNNKEYNAVPFDFNLICEFEDRGLSMTDIDSKPNLVAREYFAICANLSTMAAGKELEHHYLNGGNLAEITAVLATEMGKSDFFRKMLENATARATEIQEQKEQEIAEA